MLGRGLRPGTWGQNRPPGTLARDLRREQPRRARPAATLARARRLRHPEAPAGDRIQGIMHSTKAVARALGRPAVGARRVGAVAEAAGEEEDADEPSFHLQAAARKNEDFSKTRDWRV